MPVTLTRMAAAADLVVVVEDNVADTGITAAVAAALRASGSLVPVLGAGIPKMFLAHASRTEVLDEVGPVSYTHLDVYKRQVRIDTPGEADYFRNGGILQYVLRSLVR